MKINNKCGRCKHFKFDLETEKNWCEWNQKEGINPFSLCGDFEEDALYEESEKQTECKDKMNTKNICKNCKSFYAGSERENNLCKLHYVFAASEKGWCDEFESYIGLSEIDNQTNQAESAKQTIGKTDWSLMPLSILKRIIEVREYGNKKYNSPDNWKQVDPKHYINAIIRHTERIQCGEVIDSESGLHHASHIACNALFLTELIPYGCESKGPNKCNV